MFSKLLTGGKHPHDHKVHSKPHHKETYAEELADHTAEKAFKALKK